MNTRVRNLIYHILVVIGFGCMLTCRVIAQTYTFGAPYLNGSANLTYNSGTGMFQYTDAISGHEDLADLPLTGTAAKFVTTSNSWTASLSVNISAKSMTATSTQSPRDAMSLGFAFTAAGISYIVFFELNQENNTGGYDSNGNPDSYVPNGFYGTSVALLAQTNDYNDITAPLGSSQLVHGVSWVQLSGTTTSPNSPATESINAVTGVLTLSFNSATEIVTGYYNGTAIGSYSLAKLGYDFPLTFGILGRSSDGCQVPVGMDTASNFSAVVNVTVSLLVLSQPQISVGKTNFTFQLTGPAGTNYVLQASTNLVNWTPISTSTIPVSGSINITNAIKGINRQFYRVVP